MTETFSGIKRLKKTKMQFNNISLIYDHHSYADAKVKDHYQCLNDEGMCCSRPSSLRTMQRPYKDCDGESIGAQALRDLYDAVVREGTFGQRCEHDQIITCKWPLFRYTSFKAASEQMTALLH